MSLSYYYMLSPSYSSLKEFSNSSGIIEHSKFISFAVVFLFNGDITCCICKMLSKYSALYAIDYDLSKYKLNANILYKICDSKKSAVAFQNINEYLTHWISFYYATDRMIYDWARIYFHARYILIYNDMYVGNRILLL